MYQRLHGVREKMLNQNIFEAMIETLDIRIAKISESRIKNADLDNPAFGKDYSDHMFIADYKNGEWTDMRIVPYENLSISPANTTLHYASTIF